MDFLSNPSIIRQRSIEKSIFNDFNGVVPGVPTISITEPVHCQNFMYCQPPRRDESDWFFNVALRSYSKEIKLMSHDVRCKNI